MDANSKDTRSVVKRCTGQCSRRNAPSHIQDKWYGKGRRVHNVTMGCTVCGDSKYDKLWASSSNAPNSYLNLRYIESAERERLGHCRPLQVPAATPGELPTSK